MYFLKPFFTSPSAPTTIGTVDVFICHIFVTSISRSSYLDSFSTSLLSLLLLLLFEKCLFISDMYNQAAGNHPETCGSKKVFCLYASINIQFSVQCIIISILFRSSFILKVLCGECVPYL